jgi:hypothetical protein
MKQLGVLAELLPTQLTNRSALHSVQINKPYSMFLLEHKSDIDR